MLRRILLIVIGMLGANIMLAQTVLLTADSPAYADISTNNITRVGIYNDRIKQLYGRNEEQLLIEHNENTGELYLRPVVAEPGQKINLFVLTEKNKSYQLILTTAAVEDGLLTLVTHQPSLAIEPESYERHIELLMQALYQQKPPDNYIKVKVPALNFKNNALGWYPICSYIGPYLMATAYLLENISDDKLVLEEESFIEPQTQAIGILNKTLLPTESTLFFVISLI